MADGLTTMFGKAYDTVGSADKNLILQTRGDLKVKWGGKYIDLIKNGKINVDVDLIKKVDSKDSIFKDGIYLLEEGEKQEVWLYIGGTLINLLGEVGTTYVSFIDKLIVTPDLKTMALTNAGFYYNTLTEALEALLTKGIVYILDENKLYYVSESGLTQYKEEFVIPDPFLIGKVTIEGSSAKISGGTVLNLALGNANYISLLDEKVNVEKELLVNGDIVSHDYVQGMSGFAIYYNGDTSQTCAEFDNVKIRGILEYSNVINVTYKQLKQLRDLGKLIAGKKYRITDFRNEWEMLEYYHKRDNNNVTFTNSWPIILTADTNKTFRTLGYFCDREDWVIEYDMDFYYYSHSQTNKEGSQEDIYTMGRITKLTDGFGNSANYDFKHRLFKHTSSSDDPNQWFYTYTILNGLYNKSLYDNAIDPDSYLNTHYYADASESGLITNNILYARRSSHEDGVNGSGNSCLKLVVYDEYIIFPDCSTIYPYGNQILDSSGKFIITGNFYNNIFEGLYTELDTEFTLDYHDNTFKKVKNCALNAPMQFNTFDRNLIDVAFRCDSMSNNHITGIIYTNGNRESYPIEATHFNNNVINNINMSAITCYGCDIINNNIHNINGCTITNSTLTDITMKNISGDSSLYSNNPTDEIENVPGGNTPGGNTPDTPVNPGGGDTPATPSGNTITSEPSATSVDSKMHGVHTNANPLENTAGTDVLLGYIDSGIDSSYGTPTVYGVYVCETGSMLSNVSVVPSSTTGHSYDIIGTVTANSVTSLKKVHVWVQFADVSQMGYINVYQVAGSGSSSGDTPSGGQTSTDADVDKYLNTFKGSVLSSVGDLEYSLLSTAMDKLDTFESSVMSDNMFVDEAYTLPSGNSSDTIDARRGWYMALLLTALHPLKNSVANNDILAKAMSKWGISQSTDTNSLDVPTYEAKYKGLLQGSIAFSCLFSDSSFVNSFKSCISALGTSYSHRGDDGDLGKTSRAYAPAGQNFFPYPPTNNRYATTGLMKRDEDAFLLGKNTLRSQSRGTTAIEDIKIDLSYFLDILLAATGKNNKSGNAYTFMHDTQWDGKRTVNNIKDTPSFWRSRPAWENEDYTVDGKDTDPKSGTYDLNFGNTAINNRPAGRSNTTSYPSGHTGYFWNTAYCFAAIGGFSSNTAIVNLFKRAYQYSESRVVVGAHWQMCVEMGRIAAACSFATLCGNTKFIEELQAAQS